jgi:hypothetical protein
MGRAKIDSNNIIAKKILRKGSFTEAEIAQRLGLAKGQYIVRGRALKRKTEASSPFSSGEDNGRSTYSAQSVTIKNNGRFFKIIARAPSQPYAEYGAGQSEITPRRGDFLTIPVQASKVKRLKAAGGGRKARYAVRGAKFPVIEAGSGSRFYRAGTKLALVRRVKGSKGHNLLVKSLEAAFSRR